MKRLEESGVDLVCVLGDPAYYRRLGFAPERHVAPPYPLPGEWAGAWQSQHPSGAAVPQPGTLIVPAQWRRPALWAP